MQRGAKIALGMLVAGGVVAGMIVASEKDANASTTPPVKPPLPGPQPGSVAVPPSGGVVMVPPFPAAGDNDDGPSANSPPPLVTPPGGLPIPLPGGGSFDPSTGAGSGTVQLPQPPLGSDPMSLPPGSLSLPQVQLDPNGGTISLPGVGTFDPATGNVFGPNGIIVGTFNPATKVFTPGPGFPVPLPPIALPSSLPQQLPPVVSPSGNPTAPGPSSPSSPSLPSLPLPPVALPTQAGNPSQPTNVAADTLTTIAAMLSQEQSPKWRKIPESTLVSWQKNRGLTGDGAFGTGTALKMADETGMLPIVRAWPKGSYPEGHWLEDYRAALRAKAATASEPRKSQLLAAAEREHGQGWGTPEKPITSLIHLQEA